MLLPVELVEVVVLDMRREDGEMTGGVMVCGETAEGGTPWYCCEAEPWGRTLEEVVRVRLWVVWAPAECGARDRGAS